MSADPKPNVVTIGYTVLDIPPSVNHYWMTSGKRRYLSTEGRAWKELVSVCLRVPSIPLDRWIHFDSPLEMEVTFTFPDNHRRDIDNYLKGTLDALTGILYKDDSQIIKLTVQKQVIKGQRSTSIFLRRANEPTA